MSHELLYTSARQGLKPGSYGFCTVIATEGLSKVLQDRLESLSGYEPVFALTDRRAALNPVNYSYLVVTVANQKLHLLSRIADAGADYSGRSNKIAHHVALQAGELTAAGPASTLAQPSFCKTGFDGKPRWLPAGVKASSPPRPPGKCSAWEAVCNDAGWAGVLVERTLKNPTRPITLIYAPGCEVLPLVVEAMSLLPAELQWRTTFSTFFTKLPAGIECLWRFVLDGTPAADQARRNFQLPPIDLTNPGKVPFESPIVETARTGRTVTASSHIPTPSAAKSASPTLQTSSASNPTATREASTDTGVDSFPLGPRPNSMRRTRTKIVAPALNSSTKQGSSRVMIVGIIAGSALALILVAGLGIFWINQTGAPPPPSFIPDNSGDSVAVNKVERPAIIEQHPVAAQKIKSQSSFGAPEPTNVTPTVTPAVEVAEIKPKEKPIPFERIVKDINDKGRILSLPKREQGIGTNSGERELCKILVEKPADCRLELVTTETLNDGQPRLFLDLDPSQSDHILVWKVVSRARNAFQAIETTQIGAFKLKDQTLSFEWKPDAPDWSLPFGLLYSKLDIRIGDRKIRCSLTQPTIKPLDRIAFTNRRASLPVEIPAGTLSSVKSLRYDIELRLDNWADSKSGVIAKEKLKFEIPTGPVPDTNVDLELEFMPPSAKGEAKFAYAGYVYLNYRKPQSPLGEGFTVQRCDILDDLTKDGFIFADLDRVKKRTLDDQKKANVETVKAKKEIRAAESELKANELFFSVEDRRPYLQEIAKQQSIVDVGEDVVEKGAATIKWTSAIESRLKMIESKLEVSYRIYLEFTNGPVVEKVVLVETIPPPSTPAPVVQTQAIENDSSRSKKDAR